MPAMSAAAMGAIDPRKAGIGSGVLNASRQVGGALGIAVLGSVAAAVTASRWAEDTGRVGGVLADNADRLLPLVEGAQAAAIIRLAGDHPEHKSVVSLTAVYHNLLRQWAEV